jgi:mevalonate kinase
MDSSTIFFGSIIAALVWMWILYMIIKGASQSEMQVQLSKKQADYLEIQMRLLSELLKKQGMTHEELVEIIKIENKYFTKTS